MVRGWNLEDLIRGCQVRMDRSSLAWVEARSGPCGPETGRRRFEIWIIGIFYQVSFFLWVEHVWSSGRVRRRRDVDKLNMSGLIRMWSERGKCDGKGKI